MNLATVIVLFVVLALVAIAIYYLQKSKGSCSCGKDGKNRVNSSQCASCSLDCPFKR